MREMGESQRDRMMNLGKLFMQEVELELDSK